MNKKFYNCKPRLEDNIVPHFVESDTKLVTQDIRDEKGNVILSKQVKLPFTREIPASEFENVDIDCDMFTFDNLKKSGYDLYKQSPILTPQYRGNLDSVGDAMDYVENLDVTQLTDKDFD